MFDTFDTLICDAPEFEDFRDEHDVPRRPIVRGERAWHDAPTRIAPDAQAAPSLPGWDRSEDEEDEEATRLFRAEDEPGWEASVRQAPAPAREERAAPVALSGEIDGRRDEMARQRAQAAADAAAVADALAREAAFVADELDFLRLGASAQGSQDEHPADCQPTMAEHGRARMAADLQPTLMERNSEPLPADLQPTMAEHSRARRDSMQPAAAPTYENFESMDALLTRAEYSHPTFAEEHASELPWFVNGAEPPVAPVRRATPDGRFLQMPPQTLVTIPAEAHRVSPYASAPAADDPSVDLRPHGVIGWLRRKVRP